VAWRARRFVVVGVAIALVLAVGAIVTVKLMANRINHSVSQGDLFGTSGPSGSPGASSSPTVPPGADLKGPLNILIAGVDTRVSVPGWQPHSDAVMIMHITADLQHGYLFSLPRDLVVNIPPFPKSGFTGERTKLTHAMSFGSHVPGSSQANTAQGFQLLALTITRYTGITFNAGAILTFNGLRDLVDALGGVDAYVDQRVVSIHRQPDGEPRPLTDGAAHGMSGPQMVYDVGPHHFVGWQAIDYARQRYTAGADYTRQRHQRQLIKAIMVKVFARNMLTDLSKINSLLKVLSNKDEFVFDGRGRQVTAYAYALRNLRPAGVVLVGLPGGGVYSGGSYLGEALYSPSTSFFAAVRQDKVAAFLTTHQSLINKDHPIG
jgi:polyisoprenyl-teichoic acid--peptidoglycan teichoic acid transferase